MHDHLTDVLGAEVVGQLVISEDGGLIDLGFGRICLESLEPSRVQELLKRLKRVFRATEVQDRLYPQDPQQLVRGLWQAQLRDPDSGNHYTLQISSAPVLAFYERRFWLDVDLEADLMATFCNGLGRLVAGGGCGAPLRAVSGYDAVRDRYLGALDTVMRAAVAGAPVDGAAQVPELVDDMRRAWRAMPWTTKASLERTTKPDAQPCGPERAETRNLVLLAIDPVYGQLIDQRTYALGPDDDRERAVGWMLQTKQSFDRSYPASRCRVLAARARAGQQFMEHFPGYQGVLGTPPHQQVDV